VRRSPRAKRGAGVRSLLKEVGVFASLREGLRKVMPDRIKKDEFIRRLAARLHSDETTATTWVDGVVETLYESFKAGESVTLPGFGGFYVRPAPDSWAFKFNPGQRLRALFGWSSTYRE
jgi:hypothetical protein